METKQCTGCNRTLSLDSFPFVQRGKDQRRSRCRQCVAGAYSTWVRQNHEAVLESKLAYWHRRGKTLRAERLLQRKEGSK